MGTKKNKKKKNVGGEPTQTTPLSSASTSSSTSTQAAIATSTLEDDALREIAVAEKKKGNEEYMKKRYTVAVAHYTRGIAVASREPALLVWLLINRGTTFLRLREYQYAVEDSTDALSLDSSNIRAHIVLAFGHFFMQHFVAAFDAYDVAVKLQPQTPALQSALQKALSSLSAQHKKIKDAAMQAAKTGKKLRETALEWLGDFGLLSIDEEPLPNPFTDQNQPSPATSVPVSSSPSPTSPQSPSSPHHPNSKPSPTQSPQQRAPNGTSPTPPHTTSLPSTTPTPNPAISWAPPTSIKSELIGNDDLSLEDAPPLVAVGDTIYPVQWEQPYNVFMQSLVAMPAHDRERLAEAEKAEGNKAFQEQKYKAAVGHYSKALL